jgi:hypothetical protein
VHSARTVIPIRGRAGAGWIPNGWLRCSATGRGYTGYTGRSCCACVRIESPARAMTHSPDGVAPHGAELAVGAVSVVPQRTQLAAPTSGPSHGEEGRSGTDRRAPQTHYRQPVPSTSLAPAGDVGFRLAHLCPPKGGHGCMLEQILRVADDATVSTRALRELLHAPRPIVAMRR